MRVLIAGGEGLLGSTLARIAAERYGKNHVAAPGRKELDVTNKHAVADCVEEFMPDLVVNSAVVMPADRCESEPELAYEVNCLGARWLSRAASDVGAMSIYVSSDFVFDGEASIPYAVKSLTHPRLTYGITKLAGEHENSLGNNRSATIRTAGLFGPRSSSEHARSCFVDKIIQRAASGKIVSVVDDITMSPTYTVDLSKMLITLAEDGSFGTYNAVSRDSATWYEVAQHALKFVGLEERLVRAAKQEHVLFSRPRYTPLTPDLTPTAFSYSRPWRSALDEYLDWLLQGKSRGAPEMLTDGVATGFASGSGPLTDG